AGNREAGEARGSAARRDGDEPRRALRSRRGRLGRRSTEALAPVSGHDLERTDRPDASLDDGRALLRLPDLVSDALRRRKRDARAFPGAGLAADDEFVQVEPDELDVDRGGAPASGTPAQPDLDQSR